ncbi:hypothetical protein HY970_01760 [Candidatus Kaiserbacteria bacterium]|nr:hypothetical protein [Candidatus Kaiserbacteria bacterium]
MMGKHAAKQKVNGTGVAIPRGLPRTICSILNELENVQHVVVCGATRNYQGRAAANFAWRPEPKGALALCTIRAKDPDNGEREIRVRARKLGAVVRILKKRLFAEGVHIS